MPQGPDRLRRGSLVCLLTWGLRFWDPKLSKDALRCQRSLLSHPGVTIFAPPAPFEYIPSDHFLCYGFFIHRSAQGEKVGRGDRAVEGARLEIVCAPKKGTG